MVEFNTAGHSVTKLMSVTEPMGAPLHTKSGISMAKLNVRHGSQVRNRTGQTAGLDCPYKSSLNPLADRKNSALKGIVTDTVSTVENWIERVRPASNRLGSATEWFQKITNRTEIYSLDYLIRLSQL